MNQILRSRKCLFFFTIHPVTHWGDPDPERLGTAGLKHEEIFTQHIKKIRINRKLLLHADTYI